MDGFIDFTCIMCKQVHPDDEDCAVVSESALNVLLADAAIDIMRNRKGFRRWWDNLDEDMQQDVHACLHEKFLIINGI